MQKSTKSVVHWDSLSDYFDTHLDNKKIHPDAAVNIHIGWPVFLGQIEVQQRYLGKNNLDILDFGCGAGSLCKELYARGHNVAGVDSSTSMLKKAKQNLPKDVTFYHGDHRSDLFEKDLSNTFDVVTSMHVLDWISNPSRAIKNLSKVLRQNGILLFSIFPEQHIIDSIRINDLFEDFDSDTKPRKGYANFNGVRVPVYVKRPSFYNRLMKDLGFSKLLEYYPPYPKHFLEEYNWTGSLEPEMIILAYRKQ